MSIKDIKVPVIFVVGGPGSGKGTQCEKIVKKYGFTHLSTGDLIRDEVKSGSEKGKALNELIKEGKLVSLDDVLGLLKAAIVKNLKESKGYLIDGYPREVNQGLEFEKQVCKCAFVMFFDVSDKVMTERLMERGKTSGRVDDNAETIKVRLENFHKQTVPVLELYGDKVKKISGEAVPDDIFKEVCKVIDSALQAK